MTRSVFPGSGPDVLEGTRWACTSTTPGAAVDPLEVTEGTTRWLAAEVPGTAAGALRAAGEWEWGVDDEELLDGRDWWFRCIFDHPGGAGPWDLELGGIATLADVWLNGQHLARTENMFRSQALTVPVLRHLNELVIRCEALTPRLLRHHPRPRFKSRLVRHQSLRWYRTTLLGRMPGWSRWAAPVGPWRGVRLTSRPPEGVLAELDVRTSCDPHGAAASVQVQLLLHGASARIGTASIRLGDAQEELSATVVEGGIALAGGISLTHVQRWWPHTHGAQPLYQLDLEVDGRIRPLRRLGFRTVEIDQDDDGFEVRVNGTAVFCRGVMWGGPDSVSLNAGADAVRRSLALAKAANVNMVRLGGFGVYEEPIFWDVCDELGMMVWQDCMLASVDPPNDEVFLESMALELAEQFGALQGRPALTVASASSETYQQGSLYGLAPERYESEVLERVIPDVVHSVIDGLTVLPSSPCGGQPPIRPDKGVAHYFGVGAYLRPRQDARLAGVRFAAECLSFANPPERATVEQTFGSAAVAGHDPRWKLAVARDFGTSWDFEDVRDHYVRDLFGVDPLAVRYNDPERALDLGRAVIVELFRETLGYWRRGSSGCSGALVLGWQDLWPGAGWGLIDALGRAKASYFALQPVFAPQAVLFDDHGLAGLTLNVFNDRPAPLRATLVVDVLSRDGALLDHAERPVDLEAHQQLELDSSQMLGGFRDLTSAYRFAPAEADVVWARLISPAGSVLSSSHHLPAGPARARETDVGLRARTVGVDGVWTATVTTERFAQYVSLDVPDFHPSASWFHLAPRESVTVQLIPEPHRPKDDPPGGVVRALNSFATARIEG